MRQFENQVQLVKHEVMKEVSRFAFKGTLRKNIINIPLIVDKGPEPRFRCCLHHERATTFERINMALGGDSDNPNIIEVLDSACDKCLENRYVVTETCRGCLAHRCVQSCPVDAISIINNKANIDYKKCIECGKCKSNCPYSAVADVMRPCRRVCPSKAITINKYKKAEIDNDKCISCGACVYHCPFGAIQDKSQIVDVIDTLKIEENNTYAILAPAFSSQYNYVELGKVISALKLLGFKDIIEVALGADFVVEHEANEFIEYEKNNKVLTSSCCPSFVNFIELKHPKLGHHISTVVSPMIATARLIKSIDNNSKVVFIGPCIAKKSEQKKYNPKDGVDYVLTFEELAAMISSQDIDLKELDISPLNNASYYGRKFAATGGLTGAIKNHIEKNNLDINFNPMKADGIAECDKALKLLNVNRLDNNFIEGMACQGGCIKGPATMHYGKTDLKRLEEYSKQAIESCPESSLRIFDFDKISAHK